MAATLVVTEERYVYYIQWEDEEGLGGYLGQDEKDGEGEPPTDREEWEHWMASKVARTTPGANPRGPHWGIWWESEKEAKAALRVVKEALKQDRPMPDWAQKALAEGWKPPKGWKA